MLFAPVSPHKKEDKCQAIEEETTRTQKNEACVSMSHGKKFIFATDAVKEIAFPDFSWGVWGGNPQEKRKKMLTH